MYCTAPSQNQNHLNKKEKALGYRGSELTVADMSVVSIIRPRRTGLALADMTRGCKCKQRSRQSLGLLMAMVTEMRRQWSRSCTRSLSGDRGQEMLGSHYVE